MQWRVETPSFAMCSFPVFDFIIFGPNYFGCCNCFYRNINTLTSPLFLKSREDSRLIRCKLIVKMVSRAWIESDFPSASCVVRVF